MRRLRLAPRPDWRARVEAQGLLFHSTQTSEEGAPARSRAYWGEGIYYALSTAEAAAIESATGELQAMCLEAAGHVVAKGRYAELGIPAAAIPWIERAWNDEPPSLYGRLDLAFGPDGVPRLLEYNADTPTSLLEGAVIQWTWLADCFPEHDQLNSLHERLIDTWRDLRPHLAGPQVHFAHVDDLEDEMTIGYLRDTAEQAGLQTVALGVREIGWNVEARAFVDLQDQPLRTLFKLYPWEGLLADSFAPLIARAPDLVWMEPIWKMLLSSKGLLPILWELFPGHPNLLPAALELDGRVGARWVRKPFHGREGNNVTIQTPELRISTAGPYGDDRCVYQAYAELGAHDGFRPVIGSWLIGGQPGGIGIRETEGYVTDNTAQFVPHVLR